MCIISHVLGVVMTQPNVQFQKMEIKDAGSAAIIYIEIFQIGRLNEFNLPNNLSLPWPMG